MLSRPPNFSPSLSQRLCRLVQRCPRDMDSIKWQPCQVSHRVPGTCFAILFWERSFISHPNNPFAVGKSLKPAEVPVLLFFAHLKPKRISTNHLHGQRVTETLPSDIAGKHPNAQLKHFEQLWLFIASLYILYLGWFKSLGTGTAVRIDMIRHALWIKVHPRFALSSTGRLSDCNGAISNCATQRWLAKKSTTHRLWTWRQAKGISRLIRCILRLGWSARRPVVA